ncbi:putative formate dehydrogenase [Sporotomaculum syntrophicum]|uniref:Formate dehydrogenase n=2 Tax=Sporotomaculum syntrophicum TaxID=182264 RepID=A0A9D2WLX4_9FIRM|nr:putative formate dehydrogenase [Sporotomaculum syntrophicum]
MELVKLKINGKDVEAPAGSTILQAAENSGISIPRLCYYPDLSPMGQCRLCVVEVEGNTLLPASCVTPISAGMVIHTESPAVIEARKIILELLLANHPQDCMTCDKMGDCRLAEYAYQYGVRDSRFVGEKHNYAVDESNPFIIRDLNKCIQCGACVRACEEITGKDNLSYMYRGYNRKVTTADDVSYVDSDCVFCGQCVAVCPTGALTEKQIHGKARAWELQKVRTTCPFCGTGCNFDLCVHEGQVVGVKSSPDSVVNGRALCVKGRFGWDFVNNAQRLTTPLIKRDGNFVPASWEEAINLIAERLSEIKNKYGSDSFAALSSARCTNEENYLMQKFTRAVMGTNNVDHCART